MIEIVKFYTEWCQPCKQYQPILEEVVNSRDDVKLTEIDAEANADEAAKYGVSSVPYTVLKDDKGSVLGGFKGKVTAKKLNSIIDKAIEDNT